MTTTYYVYPAYGRKYLSVERVKEDWNNGLDFKIVKGPYVNNRDAEAYNLTIIYKDLLGRIEDVVLRY